MFACDHPAATSFMNQSSRAERLCKQVTDDAVDTIPVPLRRLDIPRR